MTTDPTTPPTPSIQILVDHQGQDGHEQERGRDHSVHAINSNQSSGETENRPSSISAFVSRFSSRSRSRSQNRNELGATDGEENEKEIKYKHSNRKSTEIRGEYANVLKAQVEYMENLREEQLKKGITHNVDGIMIPPPREGRRRSIISALSRGPSRNPSREPSLERTTTKSSTNGGDSHSRSQSRTREGQLGVHDDKEYKYSKRKSAEIKGPYADALKSQLEYMETLREDQTKKGVTHVDGIKIPDPVNPNANSSGHSTGKINLLM